MPRSSVASKRRVKKPKRAKDSSTAMPASRMDIVAGMRREPLGHLMVEKLLYGSGFHGAIATDADTLKKYSTDESIFEIRPQIVLIPKSAQDIATAVSILGKETKRFPTLSLTPRAAGTGLSGGSLTDSVVIDTCTHLNSIDEPIIRNGECTITCEPGAMWRDVEAKLKEHEYYLPPYPASKDICTIGGAVGNNSAGPDSLRYGQVADWVESLDVVLHDGKSHSIAPLSYKAYKKLAKEKHAYAEIAKATFALIEENETAIKRARPKIRKNTAGYALWNVLDVSVKEFKRGVGTFDLTRLITGSQGSLGIVTKVTLRAEKIKQNTKLITVPVFDLVNAGKVVEAALAHKPINIEVFDDLSYELAMQNPQFFLDRLSGLTYYKALFTMYATYHVRYRKKTPAFTLLITLDADVLTDTRLQQILGSIKDAGGRHARLVTNPFEEEMLWQIRRASYLLSKLQDPKKRPAAFLEDMIVPPKHLAHYFAEIKRLLKKYNVTAAIHGHGGDGHFHFYPLLDFTNKTTPALITKMADEFYAVALKYDGGLCGEHNDGIIRTPHLSKMFSRSIIQLFEAVEHTFDPDDIFNSGKKVNPRYDIKESIRKTN